MNVVETGENTTVIKQRYIKSNNIKKQVEIIPEFHDMVKTC